ncbi:PDZ domain-containing protein [Dethiobacter alkaliphilus]|uniref:PDZ/DHR/GLGF domain protein n=1 Tax=Dethiobacter alkaliphilus AHT 1 TaxID=555088 RepID=C0GF95_DETAL|nr:PDZ domain-containing protein [Dethiobacter alkaliphilus]EEG77855.1 PDZ/DHR/GLGF domain protein [Dethiobacter alkaliphilus AHT 1]
MEFMQIVRLFLGTYAMFPLNILFWIVVLLITSQYRRVARNEAQLLGRAKYPVGWQVAYSAVFGLAGGLLASALLVFFGISLIEIGIFPFVWPLAIILMLVHPRYLCFAYAGGLVGFASALLRIMSAHWPALIQGDGFLAELLAQLAGLHIPGLLVLIGILHLTESFLIAVSGHLFPSPLYIKTDHGVVGGFSLQKFWPLPLVGLVAMVVTMEAADAAIGAARMPQWWPLLSSGSVPGPGETLMYMLMPIVAGLGYGDMAVSTPPREKSKQSAVNLGLYSVVLIAVAFAAFYEPLVMIPAALFAPFGHEFLIMRNNQREFSRQPLFVAPDKGVKVMDVFPGSPAEKAGLQPHDVILAMNRFAVHDTAMYKNLLAMAGPDLELEIMRDGLRHTVDIPGPDPGIIPVPDRFTPAYAEINHNHFFSALGEKIQKLRTAEK